MTAKLWESSSTNAVSTTLNGTINDSVQTITLVSTAGLVAPGVMVINRQDGSGNDTPTKREYISFTGISTNDLTGVTRGVAGSTALSHSSGALVESVMTATHWTDMVDYLQVEHDSAGKHVISTATITYGETIRLATTSIASIARGEFIQLAAASLASIARGEFKQLAAASLASIYTVYGQDMVLTGAASIVQIWTKTLLNTSGASIVGIFTSGASGSVLTSLGANILPVFSVASSGGDMLYSDARFKVGTLTRDITAVSGSVAYTGVGFAAKAIIFLAVVDQTTQISWGISDNTSEYSVARYGTNYTNFASSCIGIDNGSSVGQIANVSSFDADGFTLAWTKNGSPGAATITVYYLAFR